MSYAIYLRKSREDREAEARGEGETLARHKTTLLDIAKNRMLDIGAIYEEIVSGETIAARPQMQRLLEEVEAGRWEGVLVMEVERLARGNGIDQGIVSQAFSVSGTKIITPYKTYDPSNEMDEDYFEFGLFMSRREYQTIKRRLIAGRIASVKEGKYMGKNNPFGYQRVKLQGEKGWTLEPIPEQAEIVRNLYKWYLEGSVLSVQKRALAAGYRTQNGLAWEQSNTLALLRNPIYCGYVTWGKKKNEKQIKNGRIVNKRKVDQDYLKVKGRHEPIIEESIWDAVQKKLNETASVPIAREKKMRNPYQGLLYCACGHKMQLTNSTRARKGEAPRPYYGLFCPSISCKMVSSRMHTVDAAVMRSMREWIANYMAESQNIINTAEEQLQEIQQNIAVIKKEIEKIDSQFKRVFELVEQGIYTTDQFVQRRDELQGRKKVSAEHLRSLEEQQNAVQSAIDMKEIIVPQMERVIDAFPVATVEERHELLKSILYRIEYKRVPETGQNLRDANLCLTLFPKIPTE